jgi:4-hydroxyproline epimerase
MTQYRFECIEGHTAGMPVRMVTKGAPIVKAPSMSAVREVWIAEYDWIRRALSMEPRGHAHMSGTMLYPPISPDADMGLLFFETSGFLPMCGHASIGSITFAIEAGLVKPRQPGHIVVDVPAGQLSARYEMDGERVKNVRFTNVPSFLLHRDLEVQHPALGKLIVDIAYGGNFYPIVEVQPNFPGCEHFSSDQLLEYGWQMQQAVNQTIDVVHPDKPEIRGVKHCMWTGAPHADNADGRAVVIAGPMLIDRSPCGTGTSARVAQRHARGLLREGETFTHESLILSAFVGRVEKATRLESGLEAVLPSIEGQAFITGRGEHYVDESHPYPHGFSLKDFA